MNIKTTMLIVGIIIFTFISIKFLIDFYFNRKKISFAVIGSIALIITLSLTCVFYMEKQKQYETEINIVQTEFITAFGEIKNIPLQYADLGTYIEYFDLPEITSFDAPIKIHLYTKEEITKNIKKREGDKISIGKIYHFRE